MDSATRRGAAFGLLEQTTERPGLKHVVHLPVLSLIGRALRRFRPIITVAKPEKEGGTCLHWTRPVRTGWEPLYTTPATAPARRAPTRCARSARLHVDRLGPASHLIPIRHWALCFSYPSHADISNPDSDGARGAGFSRRGAAASRDPYGGSPSLIDCGTRHEARCHATHT